MSHFCRVFAHCFFFFHAVAFSFLFSYHQTTSKFKILQKFVSPFLLNFNKKQSKNVFSSTYNFKMIWKVRMKNAKNEKKRHHEKKNSEQKLGNDVTWPLKTGVRNPFYTYSNAYYENMFWMSFIFEFFTLTCWKY